MKVLVVLDHPRRDSLCGAILDQFVLGLSEKGHVSEIADLYRGGFDPRMTSDDEPDWNDAKKIYSKVVLDEQARISRNDAIAFVFPIWWWSFPAMTKGWIDRVWNNGWAYGAKKLPHQKALLIGVGSGSEEGYNKRGYAEAMRAQMQQGILNYCGIADTKFQILYGALDSAETRQSLLALSHELGREF